MNETQLDPPSKFHLLAVDGRKVARSAWLYMTTCTMKKKREVLRIAVLGLKLLLKNNRRSQSRTSSYSTLASVSLNGNCHLSIVVEKVECVSLSLMYDLYTKLHSQ